MRFSALWVLAIGLGSAGLRGEEVRKVSSSDTIPLGAPFQAKIEKSALSPRPICPGSSILYQITFTNQSGQGTPTLAAAISDPMPPGTTYVAGSASNGSVFMAEQNRVVWTGFLGGPAFPPSRKIAFSVTVNEGVADGTEITNLATGTLVLPNQSLLQRQTELPLRVNCPTAPITFTLSKDRDFAPPLCPGSNIAYTIRLTNTTKRIRLLSYTIEDAIPPNATFAGGISKGGVFDSAADKVTWTGSLEPGETRSFGFSVVVDAVPDQTPILNQASAVLSDPRIEDSKTGQAEAQVQVNCAGPTGRKKWMGGRNDNDFSDPGNWDPPLVPGSGDDAEIPANSGTVRLPQRHEVRSLNLGENTTLRILGGRLILRRASTVNGLLVNDSRDPPSGPSLTIQGDLSGSGIVRNLGQMSISAASLGVALETEGNVDINGLVNLTKPSENRGSYSLEEGASLHYQGSGHNLAMSLSGPSSGDSEAAVFPQQATTATVQIDAAASADITGTVDVQGDLAVIISGAPSVRSASSPQTSPADGTVTWSGGTINLGDTSSLRNEGSMTLNEPEDGSPALKVEDGAEFTNAGTVNWNGGTIQLEGTAELVNEASGEFSGSGTIEGNVQNAGLFQVGSPIGDITVTGKYTQLATGELEMQLSSSTSFDTLQVGTATMESASLGGTLSVSLIDDFIPAEGDSFLIVEGTTEGSFSNCITSEKTCIGLPAVASGLIWEVTLGSVSLSVGALSPLYFSQFGDGEMASAGSAQTLGTSTVQLSSEFLLLNTDKVLEAAATILLKDDDGEPLSNVDLNGVSLLGGEVDVTIPASGMSILSTDGLGPLQAGSATVNSDRQLSGVVVFDSGIGAAGVAASAALPAFMAPMLRNSEINTGIALQNPGIDQVMVNLELRNSDGDLLATATIALAVLGHLALFVDEIAWTPEPDVSLNFTDFEGLVKASTSAEGVAATVIQTRPQEFVTMPVSAPTETGDLELLFAQFGDGEQDGVRVSSEVILLNLSETMTAQATIVLKGDDGVPLSGVDLDGQVLANGVLDVTITACGMRVLSTDGEGPLQVGSATVTSDKPLSGVIVFNTSAGAAGVGSSKKLPAFAAPMLKNATTNTGIAVQNPGNDQVTIDLELRSTDGNLLATASVSLVGMGHRALFVDEIRWTPEPFVTLDFTDFEGLMKASTSQGEIAATVIQTRGEILFVTMPVTLSN